MKTITNIVYAALALLALDGFALLQRAQAVLPAPDGGYPGGNTAEGRSALLSLTTGGFNTAVGLFSLRSNTDGQLNTAIGAGTLLANTADNNTATGAGALLSNSTGLRNTANGTFALFSNTTGSFNTATGAGALFSNATGNGNTANGFQALVSAIGDSNTAIGFQALFSNTTGSVNAATGAAALFHNTTGTFNTANGANALVNNTIGDSNTANGAGALFANTTGTDNTANGFNALVSNTTGNVNTATGDSALSNNTIGNGNVALGVNAGLNITTADNVICIGNVGQNVSNSCYIGRIFGVASSGTAVFVDSDGKLGTATSSRRFKEEIKPMERASEALYALKPVTFRYKKGIDRQGIPQFGLVAEDVEKINPDLVVRDKDGKPYSVRYDQVNAMLLNEFLKEHRKVQEQEATIARQQKQIEALTAGLQKVSAQLAAGKSASQVVATDP